MIGSTGDRMLGLTARYADAWNTWASKTHNDVAGIAPLRRIAEYCAYDVKVTKCVHEYALEHGLLLYDDRNGQTARVEVDWK